MRSKILAWCRAQRLTAPGLRLVCAVSGGADSVAMLHCMCALRQALGIEVAAAHYNHHLRGAESDRDEAFVRRLCRTLGVPLTVSGADVTARADLSAYSDAGQIPSWAMDAMQWANARRLIVGRDSSHLVPDGKTTRAEMAAILSAYIGK